MLSLDQVRLLEQKIEGMLALFSRLKSEKSVLEKENADLKAQIENLKAKCSRFEQDEEKLEQGILNVLNRLNDMEDAVQNALEPEDAAHKNPPETTAAVKDGNKSADKAGRVGEKADFSAEKPAETPAAFAAEESAGAQLDIF